MSHNNEHDYAYDDYGYDDDDEYADYDDEGTYPGEPARPGRYIAQQAFDWGITGSILAIILLTVIYTLSPIDAVPDFIPLAGQVDDLAAIFAGGGSVTFLAVLRFAMRSRVARWGCLLMIVLSAIGGLTVFVLLVRLFDALL